MTHTISPATDSQKLINLVGHPVLLNDLDQITEVIPMLGQRRRRWTNIDTRTPSTTTPGPHSYLTHKHTRLQPLHQGPIVISHTSTHAPLTTTPGPHSYLTHKRTHTPSTTSPGPHSYLTHKHTQAFNHYTRAP